VNIGLVITVTQKRDWNFRSQWEK